MVDTIPEFERLGSPSLADYVAGLKLELEQSTDKDHQAAVKAELTRVTKGSKENADAASAPEKA